jgi:hypothetical protein
MGPLQLRKEGSELWPGGTENGCGAGGTARICGLTANAQSILRYPGLHQSWTRAGGASRTLLCLSPPSHCSTRHSGPPYLLVNRAVSMRRHAARAAQGSSRQQTAIVNAAKPAEADGRCRRFSRCCAVAGHIRSCLMSDMHNDHFPTYAFAAAGTPGVLPICSCPRFHCLRTRLLRRNSSCAGVFWTSLIHSWCEVDLDRNGRRVDNDRSHFWDTDAICN